MPAAMRCDPAPEPKRFDLSSLIAKTNAAALAFSVLNDKGAPGSLDHVEEGPIFRLLPSPPE